LVILKAQLYEEQEFKDRFGNFVESHHNQIGMFWKILILLRWVATLITLVNLREYSGLQLIIMLTLSIVFQALQLYYKPIALDKDRYMTFFNELMASLYLYLLLPLRSDSFPWTGRPHIGWALVLLMILTVTVNLLKVIREYVQWAVRWCRAKMARVRKGVNEAEGREVKDLG
jgi:hypothetical protein